MSRISGNRQGLKEQKAQVFREAEHVRSKAEWTEQMGKPEKQEMTIFALPGEERLNSEAKSEISPEVFRSRIPLLHVFLLYTVVDDKPEFH